MPTIELPDRWVLFTPEGKADGSYVAVRADGSIACATAEDAWKIFTPRARDRAREAKQGWRIVGVSASEIRAYFEEGKLLAPEPSVDLDAWEYGFYDSEDTSDPPTIWWYVFNLPHKTPESAQHTGVKNCWGHPVIVRRHPGSNEYELVSTNTEES